MEMFPAWSAVVPRMIATCGATFGKYSHSSPSNCTSFTMSARAASFILQPSRRGSTNVSSPTRVITPARRAAPSRSMSNRTPEGTLYASTSSAVIIFQIAGDSVDDGPLGYEPAITRLSRPWRATWSMPFMPYMSPAAIGRKNVRSRGRPSRAKRSPIAANMRSGQASPDDELAATTAPSGINRAAVSKSMSLLRVIRDARPRSPFQAVHGEQVAHPPASELGIAQEPGAVGEAERLREVRDLAGALLPADHHEVVLVAVQPAEEDDTRLVEPRRSAEDVARQRHRWREDLAEAPAVTRRQSGQRGGRGRGDRVEDAEQRVGVALAVAL